MKTALGYGAVALLLVLGPKFAAAACTGVPAAVTNNQWPNTCRNLTSGVCTGVCNDGYEGGGPPTSTCQASGVWTTPVGTCTKVCPGNPPAMTGINWGACDGTVQPGRRCTGTCATGFSGSPSIACANGGWDLNSMVGRCAQGQVCTGLPSRVLNSRWPATCQDLSAGQTCTATCNMGYGPGASAACVAGAWQAPVGMCVRVCPDAPPAVTGVTWDATCAGRVVTGQRCNGTCPTGQTDRPQIFCVGGIWSAQSVTGRCNNGPSCNTIPPVLVNAAWPVSCVDTGAGQTCTAICRAGYGPGATATCNADGTWTTTGACSRVCPDIPVTPSVPGANWANCANTRVGRTCVGTCPAGQSGTPTIGCNSLGWAASSLVGQCVAGTVCSPPYPSLINGRWPDSCLNTPSGQTCTAQCNAGYGPGATVKCTAGAWEAVEGACNRVCQDAPPAMPDISWAGCAGTTRFGRRCAGTCLNGKVGSPSMACAGGSWPIEGMLGKCVTGPVCTAPFPSLINGMWPNSCLDSTSGTVCTAVCNSNYQTPGATTTCTNGEWQPVVGACGRNPGA